MFYKIILSCAALFGAAVYAETGPILVQQPEDTIFDTASNVDSVSLNCRATGDAPITYSWTKDGAPLSQASNQRLVITPGQLTITSPERTVDSGAYVCTAANIVGVVRSLPADLIFAYVDEFDPGATSSKTLIAGQGDCVSCNPPPHYPGILVNWFREDIGLVDSSDARIRVMDDGRLCFFYAKTTDAGSYRCQVKSNVISEGGVETRISPKVTVTVTGTSSSSATRIATENRPTDVTTLPREDIKFECFFFGPEPTGQLPRIQWVRTSPPGEGLPAGRALLEERGEILQILDVQPEDAGTYLCYVGDINSGASAQLNVVEAPTWVSEPLGAMKDINTMQEWNVEATSATQYTWYLNGARLETLDRHLFRNNFQTLTISNLKTTDTAMYQCFANNEHGTIYSAAQLSVRAFPPLFLSPMEVDKPAPLAATVTVVCDVDAAPAPTVTWQHDGQPITDSGHYNLTADPPNLVIVSVVNTDGGTYQCSATNQNGTVSDEGSLNIKSPTVIIDHPDTTLVEVGQSTTLTCRAVHDAYLELSYLWQRNGVEIDLSKIDKYRMSERGNGNLEILSAELEDGGFYTCVALTVADSDTSSAMLNIAGPPGPATGLAVEIENLAANLNWIPGSDNNSPITSFTIEGKTDHNDEWVELRSGENGGANSVRLVNLNPFSMYTFRVIAVNTIGRGTPSEPLTATTKTVRVAPTASPSNVGGGGGNVGDLRITWDKLPTSDWNSDTVAYNVEWQRVGSQVSSTATTNGNPEAVVYVATLGIELYMQYKVRVQAKNDMGEGPFSDWVVIYSYQEEPKTAPTGVTAARSSATTIEVTWDAIDLNSFEGELMGYKLKYWGDDSDLANANTAVSLGVGTRNTISNLEPNTRYSIVVAAYSGGGNGPDSDVISAITFKSEPKTAPTGVTAARSSATTIEVTWDAIDLNSFEGELMGYKLKYWVDDSDRANANTAVSLGVGTRNTISNLEPNTRYSIVVAAYSGGGNGPDGEVISAITFKSAPQEQPTGIRAVQSKTGVNLTVNWNGITTSSSEEPLTGYKVRYRTEGTFAEDAKTILVQGQVTTAIIRGLSYETTYLITVQGYSDGGNGASSDPALSVTIAKGTTGQSSNDPNGVSRTAGVISFSLFCVTILIHSLYHLL